MENIVGSSTNDLHVVLDATKLQVQTSDYGETKIKTEKRLQTTRIEDIVESSSNDLHVMLDTTKMQAQISEHNV